MAYKIYDDGAVIRIDNGTTVSLVIKSQIKTIDTLPNGFVRLDIGEGPLKNVFIKWSDVSDPVVGSAENLRDAIKAMMPNSGETIISNQLSSISTTLQTIKDRETDITQLEPTREDDSVPNTIFRGWHAAFGDPAQSEWAIERITRVNDEEIHEWPFGHKKQIYVWNQRGTLTYAPYDHELPVQSPLPA